MASAAHRVRLVALTAASLVGAIRAGAQQPSSWLAGLQREVRADLLVRDVPASDLGGGLVATAGDYGRLAFIVGAGAEWRGQRAAGTAHVDVVSRWLLDPFGQLRWGLYGGAGATVRWTADARARPWLLLVAGAEGPEHGGWRPAIEFGLGGGARLGVVLRRARTGAR